MNNRAHQNAVVLASEASLLRARDQAAARELYKAAADQERIALRQLAVGATRTRGILAVSLVSLLFKAQAFHEAEQASCEFLSDENLHETARKDLRRLLEVVWDERAIFERGVQYSGEELMVSLRGGMVGQGTAPLDAVLHNIGGFNSLLYRVSEWQGNFAFRIRGTPPAEVLNSVQARVTQPTSGSYRFTVRLIEPRQLSFDFVPPPVAPLQVSMSLMKVVELASGGKVDAIKEYVPDSQYRHAMLKLIRNLVPMGKSIEEVELTRLTKDDELRRSESVLLVPGVRPNLSKAIEAGIEDRGDLGVVEKGTLRALHLDRHWLEIAKEDGEHLHFRTADDVLDDVVGPMVNKPVIVRGHRESRRYNALYLDDIELDEPAA